MNIGLLPAGVVRQPTEGRVRGSLAHGVRFGPESASGYVYAAKQRYQQSLIAATANLVAFVEAAQILASAAERIAANYEAGGPPMARALLLIGVGVLLPSGAVTGGWMFARRARE